MDILLYELKKLGLKEKEAKVYLSGLELGPTSIIQIARAADITRPTAYEIVSGLKKRGLFLDVQSNKKRLFSAQSPEVLLGILRTEKHTLEEREREFLRIISQLENRFSLTPQGGVRWYHGTEGMNALEEKIVTAPAKTVFLIVAEKHKIHKAWLKQIEKRVGTITVKERILKGSDSEVWIMPDRVAVIAKDRTQGFLFENPLFISLFMTFFNTLRR